MPTDLGFAAPQAFMYQSRGNFEMLGDIRSDDFLPLNSNDFRCLLIYRSNVAESIRRKDSNAC
jgi:hypothetical protein